MPLSAKQLKAINWFAQTNQLKPQLSTPPIMYFKNNDGEMVQHDLTGILLEYNHYNEEDKKSRQRERKLETTRKLTKKFGPSRVV